MGDRGTESCKQTHAAWFAKAQAAQRAKVAQLRALREELDLMEEVILDLARPLFKKKLARIQDAYLFPRTARYLKEIAHEAAMKGGVDRHASSGHLLR